MCHINNLHYYICISMALTKISADRSTNGGHTLLTPSICLSFSSSKSLSKKCVAKLKWLLIVSAEANWNVISFERIWSKTQEDRLKVWPEKETWMRTKWNSLDTDETFQSQVFDLLTLLKKKKNTTTRWISLSCNQDQTHCIRSLLKKNKT